MKIHLNTHDNIKIIQPKSDSYQVTYYGYKLMNNLRCSYQQLTASLLATDPVLTEIEPGVFIGDMTSSCNINKLKEKNITHIISVLAGYKPQYPNHFKYLVIDALDTTNTNLEETFIRTNEFINNSKKSNGTVLIHCMMGRSRSPTVAAAYIMDKQHISCDEAINIIKTLKPNINPNSGFIEQLKQFQTKIVKKSVHKDKQILKNKHKVIKQIRNIQNKKFDKRIYKKNKRHNKHTNNQNRRFNTKK